MKMSKIPISNTDHETMIDKIFPSCGFNNSQPAKFCIECGTLVTNLVLINQTQIVHPSFSLGKPLEFQRGSLSHDFYNIV